jgi:hypothetical protein
LTADPTGRILPKLTRSRRPDAFTMTTAIFIISC